MPLPSLPPPLRALAQWLVLGAGVGVLCGAASALFLWLLDEATRVREGAPALVWALPVGGLLIGAVYARWGVPIRGGANLVLDTVHEGERQLPLRMAPMVLLGTVATHLFGGSAGREGTAVQMGASLADALAARLKVGAATRRELLAAGIAGGFGSVFGTPVAGCVFGLEVVCVGRLSYEALVPALVASVVGDLVTRGLGIVHTPYPALSPLALSAGLLVRWALFAAAVAAVSVAYVEGVHRLKARLEAWLPALPWRMAAGGLALVGLWQLSGTDAYLGLGLPTLLRAFHDPLLPPEAFAWKLAFTALTLAAGYLGGEVTPLFFIGATLGNALARPLGLPLELAAGVGLAAVFAAAANTPLALSLMAVELMGAAALPHVAWVSVLAYLMAGHRGIYPAQRIAGPKHGGAPWQRRPALRELGAPPPPPPDEPPAR